MRLDTALTEALFHVDQARRVLGQVDDATAQQTVAVQTAIRMLGCARNAIQTAEPDTATDQPEETR